MKKGILSLFLMLALCLMPQISALAGEGGVTFTAKEGSGGTGGEGYDKLIDGKKTENDFSKWCGGLPEDGAYIIIEASDFIKVTDYTLTTGNDNSSASGRNPKSWVLYGSNDYFDGSATWVALDTVTDDTTMQDVNYTDYSFTISGNTAYYKYYKLCITATQGAEMMQLVELTINYDQSCSHTWGEPSTVSAANCKTPGIFEKSCSQCGATVTYVDGGLGGHPYDENGECTICGVYRDGVAKVGGVSYSDLQTAIDAAGSESVMLGQDVVLTGTLNITGSVTIDLRGHTITGKKGDNNDAGDGKGGSAAISLTGGSLTLTGSGKIIGGAGGEGGAPINATPGGAGGDGGAGISIDGGNLYAGSGVTISGGAGGNSRRDGDGGAGGDGILVKGTASVSIDGNIIGGDGGNGSASTLHYSANGGCGGSGLLLDGGSLSLTGSGSIIRGNGGTGFDYLGGGGPNGAQGNKIELTGGGHFICTGALCIGCVCRL